MFPDHDLQKYENPLTPFYKKAFLFLAAIVSGVYFCDSIYHPKVYGHLTMGKWIASHFMLPVKDIWTEAFLGQAWYSQSWLFDLVLSAFYSYFDFSGLVLFKVFLTSLFSVLLFFCLNKLSGYHLEAFVFGFIAIAGSLLLVPLVPQLAAYSFFVLVLFFFFRLRKTSPSLKSYLAFFLLCVLYANIHHSLIIALLSGVVIVASYSGEKRRVPKFSLFSFLALGFLALFVTPYCGANLLQYPQLIKSFCFEIATCQYPSSIYHYDFGLLLMLLSLFFLMLHYSPHLARKGDLFLVIAYTFLAASHHEFVPYALILMSMLIADVWGRGFGEGFGYFGEGLGKLSEIGTKFGNSTREGSLFFLIAFFIVSTFELYVHPVDLSGLPYAELDYLAKTADLHPVLHDSFFGGYVLHKFSKENGEPLFRAAYDKRVLSLDPEFNYISKKFDSLALVSSDLKDRVRPKSIICKLGSPLCEHLRLDPAWKLSFCREKRKDGMTFYFPQDEWQVYALTGD